VLRDICISGGCCQGLSVVENLAVNSCLMVVLGIVGCRPNGSARFHGRFSVIIF
jgi:hypothetical protein